MNVSSFQWATFIMHMLTCHQHTVTVCTQRGSAHTEEQTDTNSQTHLYANTVESLAMLTVRRGWGYVFWLQRFQDMMGHRDSAEGVRLVLCSWWLMLTPPLLSLYKSSQQLMQRSAVCFIFLNFPCLLLAAVFSISPLYFHETSQPVVIPAV